MFDKGFNYLNNFGDKLIALHLHDNNGKEDEHTLTKFSGSINWDNLAKYLSLHKKLSLDYEIFGKNNKNLSAEEYLNEAFLQAKKLEDLIEKQIKNFI